jgi:hypothetical protein
MTTYDTLMTNGAHDEAVGPRRRRLVAIPLERSGAATLSPASGRPRGPQGMG